MVRHGQASFLSDDYDQLSPLGVQQSRRLGAAWAERGFLPDAVYMGPLRRHQQTYEAMKAAYESHGDAFPEAELEPGLAEFGWDALMQHAFGPLREICPEVAQHTEAFADAAHKPDKARHFQRLFERVCHLWVEGVAADESILSWQDFSTRCVEAIEHMTANTDRGGAIVAITSGGPVAVACLKALEIPPPKAIELIHTLRNAAVTSFLFNSTRYSLSVFNDTAHLPDQALLTYR